MTKLSRSAEWAYVLVGLAALVTRALAQLWAIRSPFLHQPILDEAWYVAAAQALLSGAPTPDPGFRPLLYPLYLAMCGGADTPTSALAAIAGQHLLGVLTALAVAWLAGRLSNHNPVAIAGAGLLWVAGGPALHLEGQRLAEGLFVPLAMAVVVATVVALGRAANPHLPALATIGVMLAVAALVRPNAIVLLGLVPIVLLLERRRAHDVLLATGAVVGGFTFAVVLTTAALRATDRPALAFGSSGGINLYLGLARGADGLVPRQDRTVVYGEDYRDSVAAFADEGYREATGLPPDRPAEVDHYWRRRAFAEIAADPLGRAVLLARKVGYLLWNEEIPNHLSWHFVAATTPFGWLPVRFAWLLALAPLGLIGGAVATRRDRIVLVVATGLLAGAILPFFVADRYRLALWPLMAVFAGVGLANIGANLRARHWRRVVGSILVVAAIALVSTGPWLGTAELSSRALLARDYYFSSLARLAAGDITGSAADADEAARLDPGVAAIELQRSLVALAAGDPRGALERAVAGLENAPRDPRLLNAAGTALEQLGHVAAAYQAWSRAVDGFDHVASLTNLALLELRAGLGERARAHLGRIPASSPPDVWILTARAELARRDGDNTTAERLLGEARNLDAAVVAKVQANLAMALRPEELGLVAK